MANLKIFDFKPEEWNTEEELVITFEEDSRLSLREKGLIMVLAHYHYLECHSANNLSGITNDSPLIITKTLKELEKHGYLKRTRQYESKSMKWTYNLKLSRVYNLKGDAIDTWEI